MWKTLDYLGVIAANMMISMIITENTGYQVLDGEVIRSHSVKKSFPGMILGMIYGSIGSIATVIDHYLVQNITSDKPTQYAILTLGLYNVLSTEHNDEEDLDTLSDEDVILIPLVAVVSAYALKYKWDSEASNDVTDVDDIANINLNDFDTYY